jgi:hypothetical protein
MERRSLFSRLEALGALVALAYLGFWVYGLVMGVFAIGGLIVFTIIAVALMVLLVAMTIRARRVADAGADEPDEELVKASRHQREVRGF